MLQPDEAKNLEHSPLVWVRPSQVKIKYSDQPLDPAMLWIDLLRTSHMRSPARLSAEVIINLAENKVPHPPFLELLRRGLQEIVSGLTTWEGKDAMFALWHSVAKHGCVMPARIAREAVGEARARGLSDRDAEETDEDEDEEQGNPLLERSAAWWTDQISGCPSSLEETVMTLLDAGFQPQNCAVLKEKLHKIVTSAIQNHIKRYRLDVPMSCTAFIVPGVW